MELGVLFICSIAVIIGLLLIIFNKILFSKGIKEFYLKFVNKKWIFLSCLGGAVALIISILLGDLRIGTSIILIITTLIVLYLFFYIETKYFLERARSNLKRGINEKIGRIISIGLGIAFIILGIIVFLKEGL